MVNKRITLALLSALLVTLTTLSTGEVLPAQDQSQFMFLDELQPGMEGIGKTVVSGSEIETFPIRIVDIVDNPGELDDHVLIRASGEAIERSGGIAAGMSGSPIYIDGKLIGAIWGAAAFDVSPEPIALVRPIGTMLGLLKPVRERLAARMEGPIGRAELRQVNAASRFIVDGVEFRRISTPVWVSGLNGRAFAWLKDGLDRQVIAEGQVALLRLKKSGGDFPSSLELGWGKRFDLAFYNIGVQNLATEGGRASEAKLEPGSAVGALLATGDVSIGSFGTLTYREGDLVLSFGHRFLLRGATEMFLASIEILDTVQSLQVPFKFGVPDERLGAVLEDRFQGIAGALGVDPNHIALRTTVRDRAREVNRDFDVDLVSDPDLLPSLLYSVILSSIDTAINRIGPGTLKVDYIFRGAGLEERVERQDIFYSFSDIATSAPLQIAQVAYLLAWNKFTDPKLDRVDVEISVEQEVRAYEILKLEADKEVYRPGDELQWTVTITPFRGEEEKLQGSLKIPEDVDGGRLTLHAFGGPRPSEDGQEPPKFESLEELITAIEGLESNDQLTVELLGVSRQNGEGKEADQEEALSNVQRLKDWVVVGEEYVQLEVELPEEQPAEEEEQPKQEQEEKCKQLFYCD